MAKSPTLGHHADGWLEKPVGWETVETEDLGPASFVSPRFDREVVSKLQKQPFDVILVLAGGLDEFGHVHPWVKRRLDLAVKIWENHRQCYIVCLGGGTYHKAPFLNHMSFVVHESSACADYLMRQHGVPGSKILKEWASFDTIANAFFALTNHVIPRRWTRILILTSDFHLGRTKKIFNWVFSLDADRQYSLQYFSHSDIGLDDEVIAARREREQESIKNLERNIHRIQTMDEFHHWFFTEHRAYNCILPEHDEVPRETINDRLKKSY